MLVDKGKGVALCPADQRIQPSYMNHLWGLGMALQSIHIDRQVEACLQRIRQGHEQRQEKLSGMLGRGGLRRQPNELTGHNGLQN